MRITVISLLSVVFAVSVGFLVKDYCDSKMQAELYDNLIETVEDTDDTEDTMSYSEDKNFLPDYQELYMQNNDMVGWIKVEDTKINYPVMQSKDNPNFYLRHGFDKGYTVYGCPYVQENCDVDAPSDNLVIYGHHMNDNSMFAGLMKYADKSFWEKHKTIQFDTLTEKGKYEVVAAFKTEVYTDSPNSFRCEEYHPFEHPAQSHTLSAHHHNEHSGQFLHHNSVRHGKVCYSGQCNQTLHQTYAVPK